MHCHRQCPQPCSRPQPTHASARDCQILMGKYGSVSCGVTAFFSLVLVCIWVLSLPSKSLFPQSCVSFGSPMVGFMATFSKGLCHTQVCCTQGPCPCGRPLLTRTSAGDTQTLKGRSGSVSVGAPGVHKILIATGLEKVSFHSNPKERQCQRMSQVPHNCTHFTF